MGNRAGITSAPYDNNAVGIYVHWNGGRASVEGFLQACKQLGFRSPEADPRHSFARLTQAIATFFGNDGLSVGVGRCCDLDTDNYDNGVYLIGGDWEIVGREFWSGEEEVNPEKTEAIAAKIVAKLKAADAVKEE